MPSAKVDLVKVEKKITDLSTALANLSSGDDLRQLIRIIRKPGWTTPAELALFNGLVDGLMAQAKVLDQMKAALMKGSNAVAPQ